MLFSFNKLLNSVFSCQCILHYDVMDVWLWCYYTCRIAFYCSSHLAGSVSSADIVLKNIQYDVGPISFPTSSLSRFPTWSWCRFQCRASPISAWCRPDIVSDIELLWFSDIGQMSAWYRWRHLADIEPTCKHGVGPISADICRYRPDIFCRHQAAVVADICRYRTDIEPLWFSEIGPISADICRYRPDIFCRHQAAHSAVVADICRYRADIEPLWFSDIESISARCRPDIFDDIWPTSSPRANMESARHLPISARYNFRHQADVVADICRHLADRFVLSGYIISCYLLIMFVYIFMLLQNKYHYHYKLHGQECRVRWVFAMNVNANTPCRLTRGRDRSCKTFEFANIVRRMCSRTLVAIFASSRKCISLYWLPCVGKLWIYEHCSDYALQNACSHFRF